MSQCLEDALQQMEDGIAGNIGDIIRKIVDYKQISDDEKWIIALLMSMLWIRGPIMRKQINQMSESILKKLNTVQFSHPSINKWFDKYDRETKNATSPEAREKIRAMIIEGKYSVEFSNSQHLRMFESFQGFANLFFGQDWIVNMSCSHKKFITSDNPIVVVMPERKDFWGPSFLERTHHFTLTPKIHIISRYPTKDSGKKLRRKTLFEKDNKEILRLNFLIANHAHKFAYANQQEDINDVVNVVKKFSL